MNPKTIVNLAVIPAFSGHMLTTVMFILIKLFQQAWVNSSCFNLSMSSYPIFPNLSFEHIVMGK